MKKTLIRRILLWIDQGLNVWFSGHWNDVYLTDWFGDEDETISSVLGKLHRSGQDTRFRRIVDGFFLLFLDEEHHCRNSIEDDEGGRYDTAAV